MALRDVEEAVAALAAGQHGIVTRGQLLRIGLSGDAVDRRLRNGRLRRMHPRVFSVVPVLLPRGREMAAVLACGPAAAVSHGSGAGLLAIAPPPSGRRPVEVILRTGNRRPPGVRVRRIRTLRPDEVTAVDGIRVTTAARTLLDLAGVLRPRSLERGFAEALARGLTTEAEVRALAERHRGRRGARRLRSLVDRGPPARTRSEAEERLLRMWRRGGLPEPECNVRVAQWEVDVYLRTHRLAVEVDGRAFHRSNRAFESDRRRDAELAAAGVQVVRVTWKQITEQPEAVLVRLAAAVALRARGYSNPS